MIKSEYEYIAKDYLPNDNVNKKFKLCFYLGLKKGKRLYKYLKTVLEEKDYAFEMDELCGLIEYLIIRENYRRQGIGFVFINHIMYDNEYVRYIAKVGDNNYKALKIGYEYDLLHV